MKTNVVELVIRKQRNFFFFFQVILKNKLVDADL